MTNRSNNIHGGCSAYIIDWWVLWFSITSRVCHAWFRFYSATTLVLVIYSLDVEGKFFVGVSQSLAVTYHSPAVAYVFYSQLRSLDPAYLHHIASGDKLKIVSHTVAGGSRAKTARCEVSLCTHVPMCYFVFTDGCNPLDLERNTT
jgi:acyl-coenzyme A thioesterase 13